MSAVLIFAAVPFGMIVSAAKTVTVLDGQVSVTDSSGTGKVSDGVVTITVKGGLLSSKTNTITISNDTEEKSKLTFNYTAENCSSVNGINNGAGTYEGVLEANASITIKITAGGGYSTATLTLRNFNLVAASDSSKVTFEYNRTYGIVTVDGVEVANGDIKELPLAGASLVATPINNSRFLGWVNEADNSILSQSAEYTITPAEDMTVKAVFINEDSKPHFMIGGIVAKTDKQGLFGVTKVNYFAIPSGTHLFDDLNEAAVASASSSTSKGIVLLNNATLCEGTYTIPAGSTLLIPFDDANSTYKTEAVGREFEDDIDGNGTEEQNDPTKTERYEHGYNVYRNLTMASGANIILNGELCVPAKHIWAQGATYGGGSPVDGVGQITMKEGSSITINNGGGLYAYGFITGNGTVTAKNGAKVYEYFQLTDFRGGSQSTDMKNGVFPTSQYYVQNIEVPLTLEYGAREYSYTTLHMSSTPAASSIDFIGPDNAMFNLESGSVTKRYDGNTDRLVVEVAGKMTVSPINMKISSTNSLDSKKYELPINGNISLTVRTGSQIIMGQDIALLPGSEIIVEEGALCTVGEDVNVYIYDADEWGNYTGAVNKPFIPAVNAPGRTYNRTNADLVDAKIQIDGTIDASKGYVYTTAGGANVFSTGTGKAIVKAGTQTVTHQLIQGTGYDEIPITPVKLKNADGSYQVTISSEEGKTYTYAHDVWWDYDGEHNVTSKVTEPTCKESGYTTHTCPCGYSLTDSTVPPTNEHKYESVVTAPTCTEKGYTTYTCSNANCNDSYIDNYVAATGHSFGDWNIKTEAKHSAEGEKYRICSICDDKEEEIIPVIVCDYDGDGKSDGVELSMLRKFILRILEPENSIIKKLFDMNDDGKISLVDLVKLKKFIAGIID